MLRPPIFFAAFANDNSNWLSELAEEESTIRDIMKVKHDTRVIEFLSIGNTSIDDIYKQFNRYYDRITVFHFGGHTNSNLLQLRGQAQRASNLAKLMGMNKNLHLAVLNGCSNQEQVRYLLEMGVKVVIATSCALNDRWANIFACQFYSSLDSGKNILDSFDTAIAYMEQLPLDPLDSNLVTRDFIFNGNSLVTMFPWGIFTKDKNHLNWKLPSTPFSNDEIIENKNYIEDVSLVPYNDLINNDLVNIALAGLSKKNLEIEKYLSEYQQTKSPKAFNELKNLFVSKFPFSVSIHISDLFAEEMLIEGRKRIKKINDAYFSVSKLSALIALSNIWVFKIRNNKNNRLSIHIHPEYLKDIRKFLYISKETANYFDYMWLLTTIQHILKENEVIPFVQELNDISYINNTALFESYRYFEKLKMKLLNNCIHNDEIVEICIEAEKHLGFIFNVYSFLADYEFVSVKNISVRKQYGVNEPNFVHEEALLRMGCSSEPIDRKKFTEDRSILVTKALSYENEKIQTHNLLPFLFDLNAFSRENHKMSCMCIFHHREGNDLVYQVINKRDVFFNINKELGNVKYKDLKIIIDLMNEFEKDINI